MTASPVRISDKLKKEIVNNVHTLYGPMLDEVNKQRPDVGDRLYEIMYGPYIEDMNKLPAYFMRTAKALETRIVDGLQTSITFSLSERRRIGNTHPMEGPVRDAGYADKIVIDRTPETEEVLNIIVAWQKQKLEVVARRDAGAKAITRVLNNFKSLAPAIKMFPPIVDLLPAYVRIKVSVPQHRLTSAAMELDPALKQLATDIAVSKLTIR